MCSTFIACRRWRESNYSWNWLGPTGKRYTCMCSTFIVFLEMGGERVINSVGIGWVQLHGNSVFSGYNIHVHIHVEHAYCSSAKGLH